MVNFKNAKIFFVYYLPILLWMGFIFYLSSVPNLKAGASSIFIEFILRKIAHLAEYAVLAFLFARIFYKKFHLNFSKVLIFSLMGVFLFSLGDEFHQLFIIGRSGNFFDVGVDLFGAIVGLLIFKKIIE